MIALIIFFIALGVCGLAAIIGAIIISIIVVVVAIEIMTDIGNMPMNAKVLKK